uniref:F-box domain-containing protein n=1 Tax=Parastrongyloides trichosuri TaxID=131310 RepID=A0A0N4Z322_PARTI
MENNLPMEIALSQSHILKRVLRQLDVKEQSDLQLSCHALMGLVSTIKTVTHESAPITNLRLGGSYFTERVDQLVEEYREFMRKVDPIRLRILENNENERHKITEMMLKISKKELKEMIESFVDIYELKFRLQRGEPCVAFFETLMSVNHPNVMKLSCDFNMDVNNEMLRGIDYTAIFKGFPQLKNFHVDVNNQPFQHMYEFFLKAVSAKKGAILNFAIESTYDDDLIDIARRNMTSALSLNVNIGIQILGKFNENWIFSWLRTLTPAQLGRIVKLEVKTFSMSTVKCYACFAVKLTNLETFIIRFHDSNTYKSITRNIKYLNGMKKRNASLFPSLENLTKMTKFGWVKKYKFAVFPDEEMYEAKCSNFGFSLLEKLPTQIQKLHLCGLYSFRCSRGDMISRRFPELTTLMLNCVQEVDRNALVNLTNLKIFMTKDCPVLDLPDSLVAGATIHRREDSSEYYHDDWKENFTRDNYFFKEIVYSGIINSSIFCNEVRHGENVLKVVRIMSDKSNFFHCL